MCGIIGIFGRNEAVKLVLKGLDILKNRGKDGFGLYYDDKKYFDKDLKKLKVGKSKDCIGHCLHSVVGFVEQPLAGKGILAANCEIYNWKELGKAKNDSEMLLRLLDKKNISEVLKSLDGVYAFAYLIEDELYLARDIIGVKPLWYSHSDGFAFASEKKALEKLGYLDINELNPRKILKYHIKENKVEFIDREFFRIEPEIKDKKERIVDKVNELFYDALIKRVPDKKFGVLFSGGIDSTFISYLLKKKKKDFTCYTAVLDEPKLRVPEDLVYSERIAKELGLKLKVIKIRLKDIEKYLKVIVPLIEDSNVVKVGVALTFYAACEQAKKDGCKVVFSGLGSEEIFAGYQRHRESLNINKECVSGLLKMYERDMYRDDVITMFNNLELRLPFLDKRLVEYSLRIPAKYKIADGEEKHILREAARKLKLNEDFCIRKKKAAQYGSNFDKAIHKLSKKNKFKFKSEYLKQFYPAHNVKLGALVSSGKDSIYAIYVMLRQNYSVDCLITIKSKNPDSYMFHTPTVDLVKLQAESMGIPLIVVETEGEKEKELDDLKKALEEAKKKYRIQGVVSGAIFSNYQRERVEKVADGLGLKIFSPLWHKNQETYLRELIHNGFKFIITKVMCDGLDKSWLGKEITLEDVDKLVELDKKIGINVAGEGGEYESLMVYGPLFNKKIKVDYDIKVESKNVAELIIKKSSLI
ncbi:MAG: diphthine--ammonia ligase [Nanoarchaeota archaeon]